MYDYGTVKSVGDGVARVEGLQNRVYGELLEFKNGVFGMADESKFDIKNALPSNL